MRVVVPPPVEDLPPPPYSSEDPHASTSPPAGVELPASTTYPFELPASEASSVTLPVRTSLRGGYLRPVPLPVEPALPSAVAYFEERPCTGQYPSFILRHQIILDTEVAREDLGFPQPEERYRARDVTTTDWSTFVNFLLPEHHLSPLDEARRYEDKKEKRPIAEVDTPERREQIETVVGEWNSGFFGPRGIHVYPEFATPAASSSRAIPTQPASHAASVPSQSAQSPSPNDTFIPQSPPMVSPQPMAYGVSRPPAPPVPYPQLFMQDELIPARNPEVSRPHHRSRSSSSSTASSIPSISSTDLEGTTPASISTSLDAFRLSPTKFTHLASSVRQLRDDIRSQRRPMSKQERKQQSKEFKEQMKAQKKEIKKEVKRVVKEVQAMEKEERKLRRRGGGRCDGEIGVGSSSRSPQINPNIPDAQARPQQPPRQSSWREVAANARSLANQQSHDATMRAHSASARAVRQGRDASARGLQQGLDAAAAAREQALDAHQRATKAAADASRRAKETAAQATQRGVETAEDARMRARQQAAEAQRRAAETAARSIMQAGETAARSRMQAERVVREARETAARAGRDWRGENGVTGAEGFE